MPELSLDALREQGQEASVQAIEYRRVTTTISDADIEAAGLANATNGVFGLSSEVAEGSTLFYVQVSTADDRRQWSAMWQRMRDPDVPDDVLEESKSFGGMAGLERRLSSLWTEHPETKAETLIVIQYALGTQWQVDSKLMRSRGVPSGGVTLRQVGSFWDVENAALLSGVSLLRAGKGKGRSLSVTAIGRAKGGEWPDAASVEARMWHDLLQVVIKSK